jgi:Fe-S-cluster containining protein
MKFWVIAATMLQIHKGKIVKTLQNRQHPGNSKLNSTLEQNLCLTCGLCCDGVIFADVQLQPRDNAMRLESFGFPLTGRIGKQNCRKFPQPCVAFDGCRCRIYPDRPTYCRDFECLLLKKVQASRLSFDAARRIIDRARKRADRVRQLLRKLGDTDEQLALATRFRHTQQRLERLASDDSSADLYGDLTLAVHDLNQIITDAFYPAAGSEDLPSQ